MTSTINNHEKKRVLEGREGSCKSLLLFCLNNDVKHLYMDN